MPMLKNNKSKSVRMTPFTGTADVLKLVKSTLGPKGMDKILESKDSNGKISISNDGATILKYVRLEKPASKILIDISKVQDTEVGDGTTSVVVLTGELIK